MLIVTVYTMKQFLNNDTCIEFKDNINSDRHTLSIIILVYLVGIAVFPTPNS